MATDSRNVMNTTFTVIFCVRTRNGKSLSGGSSSFHAFAGYSLAHKAITPARKTLVSSNCYKPSYHERESVWHVFPKSMHTGLPPKLGYSVIGFSLSVALKRAIRRPRRCAIHGEIGRPSADETAFKLLPIVTWYLRGDVASERSCDISTQRITCRGVTLPTLVLRHFKVIATR